MNIKKSHLILAAIVVFVLVLLFGFSSMNSSDDWVCQNGKWIARGNPDEKTKPIFDCRNVVDKGIAYDVYCEQDSDCACGGHITKKSCFIGNKRYIDAVIKCDKLCTDDIKIQCIRNQCKQAK